MNCNKILNQASLLAAKAKPGHTKINGKLYTFEFSQTEWVYKIYEDGFYLLSFNTKSLAKAKKWLQEYLSN